MPKYSFVFCRKQYATITVPALDLDGGLAIAYEQKNETDWGPPTTELVDEWEHGR